MSDYILPLPLVFEQPKQPKPVKVADTVHFYDADGKMFDLKLEDGLKQGLFPSVTTMLGMFIPKNVPPWMVRQALSFYRDSILNLITSPEWQADLEANMSPKDSKYFVAFTCQAIADLLKGNFAESTEFRNTQGSDFGTICHALCANYVGNIPVPDYLEVKENHLNAVAPVFKWIDDNVAEQIYTEKSIVHKKYKYAGTLDCFAKLKDGRYCLYDFKFKKDSWKFPMHPDWTYPIQLSAYARWIADERNIPINEIHRANILAASQIPGDKYMGKPRALACFFDRFWNEKNQCDVYWNAFSAIMKLFNMSIKGPAYAGFEIKK